MNTDSQCETPEQDSFMSLISEPTAGTLDGDISFDMQNGVYSMPISATDAPEQSFPAGFLSEPGVVDMEGCDASQLVQGDADARSSDVAVSRSDYNRALFDARMAAMGDVELKMPWESGIMKQIFDSDDESLFPRVVPPLPPACLLPVSATSADMAEQAATEMPSAKSLVQSDITLLPCHFILLQFELYLTETCLQKMHCCGRRQFRNGSRSLRFWVFLAC